MARNVPIAPNVQNDSSHAHQVPGRIWSKWYPEDNTRIIKLRQTGMKWDEIGNSLSPPRSAGCCRTRHNYLEKPDAWDDKRKVEVAILYDRLKPEMWAIIAEEVAIPWRAAERIHWQLQVEAMATPDRKALLSLQPAEKPPQVSNLRSLQLPPIRQIDIGFPEYGSEPPNYTESSHQPQRQFCGKLDNSTAAG
ncbi:hypothetical protein AJ80_09995 [Polytolypa hystricis UAMH7299]|uniref:Myb-like domain-containing protein n=1 Tax=Polytolypa hystricis (strain UAMH7299) TaxID=1447883 RepID=A0A2B7WF88_POLH7|nr:hypothetical protein AJ80_09995 [Polytolypa hystricis UAMH7299]